MGQLANYLADDFTLYSNLHAEIVRDHCKMRGTNISTYLAALADESTADATVARKIYGRLGITYDPVWARLKPQTVQGAAGLVENFAGMLNVSSAEFCGRLASDPKGSAQRLSYKSVRASRSYILRAVSP
jgi:hypothetical protein